MTNWDNVKETQGIIPEGKYRCSVHHINITDDTDQPFLTSSGDVMWKMQLHVDHGKHQGAIIYDNLIFSEKAIGLVKFICKQLGLEMEGEFDLSPDMLIGKKAYVTVQIEEYNNNDKNSVPWSGYHKIEDDEVETEPETTSPDPNISKTPDNDLPF